jgi:hypothetical protein
MLMSRTSPFRRAGCLGKAGFILALLALLLALYAGADTVLRGVELDSTTTITPEPAPPTAVSTAAPVTPHPPVVARVTADYLNQREGPGVEHAIQLTLQLGDQLQVIARAPGNAWVNVIAPNGQTGWVNSHYMDILEGNLDALPAGDTGPAVPPTLEATPSNPPPTVATAVELDEQAGDYSRQIRDVARSYISSFERLSDLALSAAANPLLFLDQDWGADVAEALATWQLNGELIRGLQPPAGLESVHSQILAATGHFDRSGVLLREGIDERSPGDIWQAIGEMRLGYDAVKGALDEFGSIVE